jgi:hypothetical protein
MYLALKLLFFIPILVMFVNLDKNCPRVRVWDTMSFLYLRSIKISPPKQLRRSVSPIMQEHEMPTTFKLNFGAHIFCCFFLIAWKKSSNQYVTTVQILWNGAFSILFKKNQLMFSLYEFIHLFINISQRRLLQ